MTTEIIEPVNAGTIQNADVRYTFTGQFLEASTLFVRRIREIESQGTWSETDKVEHRGLVVSVVMQTAAALETEVHEISVHGPGCHLGSNGIDLAAQSFLKPIAEIIDDQSTLDRFDLILHLLKKEGLEHGANPYQSAALLIRLRNEIVHYKSRWGLQMENSKFLKSLAQLGHKPPPFAVPGMNFFPHQCLNADLGAWAVTAAVDFLDVIYARLGVQSRFHDYRSRVTP
jgi:hypothetical protein